ncbi:HAMP domain-containing histidine kinase [Pyxidicoccus parkwayensis]|uniref:histidine kinase n=1 Tax=Pyxidicoccus parkwayensis TaxID=2813578 RepID=A0ABX7P6Q0_9BACT|nr:HAMP domain-containing sensor histidine kinase [Pyxidicoccus parkwaysis]QSQ26133.1 HAMP domain-containing histidine kinase [Pyxidicoccus parkwaysis]
MDSRTRRNFKDIQLRHLSRIFGRMVVLRASVGAGLFLAVAAMVVADGAPWRMVWLVVQKVCALSFFFFELRRYKREGLTKRSVPINLLLGVMFQQSLVMGTGGLASPLLFMVFPLAFVGATTLPRVWHLRVFKAELLALTLMAVPQLAGWLPMLPLSYVGAPPRPWMFAIALGMFLLIIATNAVGAAIRMTFDDMLLDALAQRDELLATHRSYSRALESMSGEIAHELKNPLATVKGLTQLMVREAGRAQPTERLEVLSSEVVRMQGILEEFLNFSRPLVPLSVSAVDLVALCDEELVLHEGLAAQGEVKLERVGVGPVHAVCDPRKVKQVVMNLLHNAIEASPRGGHVILEVDANSIGEARVSIKDQGEGLPLQVAGRAFEAGVTSKSKGSGLGLTVARALARQHGGDVKLENASGGGCVAELVLPRELPADILKPVGSGEVAHVG